MTDEATKIAKATIRVDLAFSSGVRVGALYEMHPERFSMDWHRPVDRKDRGDGTTELIPRDDLSEVTLKGHPLKTIPINYAAEESVKNELDHWRRDPDYIPISIGEGCTGGVRGLPGMLDGYSRLSGGQPEGLCPTAERSPLMPDKQYCCAQMTAQLNYHCDQHGDDWKCPDVVVAISEARYFRGDLMLIARNAEYSCDYCPWCGKKWVNPLLSPQEAKYRELDWRLDSIRDENGGTSSPEEDAILEEMDECWWTLSDAERARFGGPSQRPKKRSGGPPK